MRLPGAGMAAAARRRPPALPKWPAATLPSPRSRSPRRAVKVRESIEVREHKGSFRGYSPKQGGAVFSRLLSLAVLVLCVISSLKLPSLNTDLFRLPKDNARHNFPINDLHRMSSTAAERFR